MVIIAVTHILGTYFYDYYMVIKITDIIYGHKNFIYHLK